MIRLESITVHAGSFTLAGIDFALAAGEYGVLMGKTGSGKTTILEAICGLRRVSAGRIVLMGRDATALKSAERGIGYVPQDIALFSNLTVREHLAFALRIRRWSEPEIARRVDELAEMLGLGPLLGRHPFGLSGGEAQRVAMGRALSASPGILCLDEPLSALDDDTRGEMYDLIKTVRRHTGVTALHITHNSIEARGLADRMFVLRDGRLAEAALPARSEAPLAPPWD